MKCPYCGKELKDGIKFCSGCGQKISIRSQIQNDSMTECKKCGKPIKVNSRFCKICGWDQTKSYQNGPAEIHIADPRPDPLKIKRDPKPPKKSNAGMIIAIIGIVILIVAVAVGTALYYKKTKTSSGQSNPVNTTTKSNEKTEAATEEPASTTEVDTTVTMDYTNNASCNVSDNLTVDDFERVVSEDGTYYFSYPKYVFNHFSYSEDEGYSFWYEDSDGSEVCSMHVYSYAQSGDPKEIAASLQKQYISLFAGTPSEVFPQDISSYEIGDSGLQPVVLSGWLDSGKTVSEFICASNDGSATYYMDFINPDSDPENEKEDWDYIVDTIYRLSSFSCSKRAVSQNYDEFRK